MVDHLTSPCPLLLTGAMSPLQSRSKLLIPATILISTVICLLLLLRSGDHHHLHAIRSHMIILSSTAAAARHCSNTLYRDLCLSTLLSIPDLPTKPIPSIITAAVNHTAAAVAESSRNCSSILHGLGHSHRLDSRQRLALTDCIELLDTTLDDLRLAVSDLRDASRRCSNRGDLSTVLSAAITNQYTCLDGFAYVPEGELSVRPKIQHRLLHISRLVSNALAMTKKITAPHNCRIRGGGREAFEGYGSMRGGFPGWLKRRDRQLLQAPVLAPAPAPAPGLLFAPAPVPVGTVADLVVTKDGSGDYRTVGEAVAAAPNNSATRFVIYIKAGGYFENVEVGKNKINLMFVGDGMSKTVIKASRNVVDGWTTFRSATVAVVGKGFIARDLTIENAAGPSKHQAVALRCGADLSAFFRCSFVGYQDTLYVHSLRQFYRECDIYGTVDFVFGDASVVLQKCNLYARKPDPDQKNIFTAQGREDPNQNTGISMQSCKVEAAADLIPVVANFTSYLGRPWKQYSRTVVMQSYLGSLIHPAGWLEWNGTFALDTLFYGEYLNRGPGSNTSKRVSWLGFRVMNSSAEALNFTVADFIEGDQWLGSYSIPFDLGVA